MPRMNHVNLGVLPGGRPDMIRYLTEVLGFRPAYMSESIRAMGASWFEGDDGVQVHLSDDPDHRAPKRAHVAVDYGDELDAVGGRLRAAGIDYTEGGNPEVRVLFCADPAGNRWELRGAPVASA